MFIIEYALFYCEAVTDFQLCMMTDTSRALRTVGTHGVI
jgi:hypothetical protein